MPQAIIRGFFGDATQSIIMPQSRKCYSVSFALFLQETTLKLFFVLILDHGSTLVKVSVSSISVASL